MSPIPAWDDGAARYIAVERRQEREEIAADVEALGCVGESRRTCDGPAHNPYCPIAIAAMIRAKGKKS